MNLEEIRVRLAEFAKVRNWEQFHSPKNLAMALAVEAAELLEIFQWLTEQQSNNIKDDEKEMALIREEIADIFIYLIRLSDKLGVDIEQAVTAKIAKNDQKYPIKLSRGIATKYNKL